MAGINADRLLARLDAFAQIGATAAGGVDRQALTRDDRAARALLARFGRDRGFEVEQDPVANLFITRAGARRDAPPLLIGSHLDTQPSGGRFDGALGVVAAFEVLERLEDEGTPSERDVTVVAWTNEEGSRFSPGAMGSRAFVEGAMEPGWLRTRDRDGTMLHDDLEATLGALVATSRPLGFPISAYVELHIEQGPVLEQAGVTIGVVEGIQGVRWLEVILEGQSAHAGTTPLAFRHDPMRAAAESLSALYGSIMPQDKAARFTVGRIAAQPGSVNAIPEKVSIVIDLRHPELAALDRLDATVRRTIASAAAETGCTATITTSLDMTPLDFDATLKTLIERSAAELGLSTQRVVSGAYHDALHLARVAPAAMIFVPSRGGLSHNPAEFTAPEHILWGAAVLQRVVQRLGSSLEHR